MRSIDESVLKVLSAGKCDGSKFCLPQTQLDRKLYVATNDVLTALGGKWNRSAKAHVFADDCSDLIDAAIETGSFTKPSDMGWFATPTELAERIVELAQIENDMLVLEPSAGEGALVLAAQAKGARVIAHEIDAKRAQHLAKLAPVTQGDFLEASYQQIFDRVVMNPPFAKRADIHHVLHARKFLKPNGLLVSIMSGGIMFREDKLTKEFREQCETIDALPDSSFRESGTDVRTVVIAMGAA